MYQEKFKINKREIAEKLSAAVESALKEAKEKNKKFRIRVVGSDGVEHLKVNIGVGFGVGVVFLIAAPIISLIGVAALLLGNYDVLIEELVEDEPPKAA
jgi:hypothetical protein